MRFNRTSCWAGASAALALTLGACSSETGDVKLAYLVSEDQAVGSVSLFGTTLAVLGTLSVFPDHISAAAYPPPCMLDAATPETGHSLAVAQSCEYVEAGKTSCSVEIDASDCSILQGVARHAPVVFTAGEGAKSTLQLAGFKQISPSGGEIQFDGSVEITSTATSFSYAEAQTVVARTSADDPEPTELVVASSYNIAIAADKLTVSGAGVYTVGSLGANNVTISDLVIPLDDSCKGPTSGSLKADLIALGSAVEGFEIAFSACDTAELIRYKNETEQERATLPVSTVAGMFAATYDAIKSIALTAQNAQPAADAPFAANALTTASDGRDLWCRFIDPTAEEPLLGGMAAAPTTGVAECLAFAAKVTNLSEVTSSVSLTTLLASLNGPLSDLSALELLGARASGTSVEWDGDATLSGAMMFDLAPTISTIGDFEASSFAYLQGGQNYGPFATDTTLGGAAPLFNCLNDPPASDGPKMITTPTDVETQCLGSYTPFEIDAEFTRLGMWLTNGDNKGLYYRVVE